MKSLTKALFITTVVAAHLPQAIAIANIKRAINKNPNPTPTHVGEVDGPSGTLNLYNIVHVSGITSGAGYNSGTRQILLSPVLLQGNKDLLKAIIMHEYTHHVQSLRGDLDGFHYMYDKEYQRKLEAEADLTVCKYGTKEEILALLRYRMKLFGVTWNQLWNYNNSNIIILVKGLKDRLSGI